MKLIIAGSRIINNYDAVCHAVKQSGFQPTEIVSGKARGVDTLGERYAYEQELPVKEFPYLSQYGKAGGPIRNKQMADYCDAAVIVWHGENSKSKGSRNMIEQIKKLNKPYYAMPYYEYTQEMFNRDITTLVDKIRQKGTQYSAIFACSRGGLIPGVIISHKLGVPFFPLFRRAFVKNDEYNTADLTAIVGNGYNVLIVDDIIDSGKTFDYLIGRCQYFYDKTHKLLEWDASKGKMIKTYQPGKQDEAMDFIDTAALIYNTNQDKIKTDLYGSTIDRSINNGWIEFWWEKNSVS